MQFEGAHLRERGRDGRWVEWWVVIVKRHVLENRSQRERTRRGLERQFGQPVVLMAQDSRGIPTYSGREDLVEYMAAVPLEAVPWQRFTLRAA